MYLSVGVIGIQIKIHVNGKGSILPLICIIARRCVIILIIIEFLQYPFYDLYI